MRGILILLVIVGCSPGEAPVVQSSHALMSASADVFVAAPDEALGPFLGDFGERLGSAGDLNGDGYGDAYVLDPSYDYPGNNSTMVAVYYGGPAGLDTAESFVHSFPTYAGGTLRGAAAGDVNGDGFTDLAVGIYSAAGGDLILFYGGSSGLSDASMWTYAHPDTPLEAGDVGKDVAIGDWNGDGWADLAAGSQNADGGQGACFVFYGTAGGLPSSPDLEISLGAGVNDFGTSLANAGDVDADGYADLLVGAGADADGGAWLFWGGAAGLDLTAPWSRLGATGQQVGYGVAGVGDVNGDSYADFAVSSFSASSFLVELFLGSSSGPGSSPFRELPLAGTGYRMFAGLGDVNGDGFADVGVNNGAVDVYLGGPAGPGLGPDYTTSYSNTGNGFGTGVAGVDINGDGFGDLLVGEPMLGTGRAQLFYGGGSGRGTAPSWTIAGDEPNDRFGWAIAANGDLNGDGYDDIVVGAPYHDEEVPDGGAILTFLMGPDGVETAFPPYGQEWPEGHFGAAVAFVGDTDGDGYDDVVVGAPERGNNAEGQALWANGGPGGDGGVELAFGGEAGDVGFGTSVAHAGDVNGDGFADFVVGAPGYVDLAITEVRGAAYLWLGGIGPPADYDWSWIGETEGALAGTSVAGSGTSTATASTMWWWARRGGRTRCWGRGPRTCSWARSRGSEPRPISPGSAGRPAPPSGTRWAERGTSTAMGSTTWWWARRCTTGSCSRAGRCSSCPAETLPWSRQPSRPGCRTWGAWRVVTSSSALVMPMAMGSRRSRGVLRPGTSRTTAADSRQSSARTPGPSSASP